MPEAKKQILAEANEQVNNVLKQYKRGLITEDERYNSVIKIWEKATDDVTEAMKNNFEDLKPSIYDSIYLELEKLKPSRSKLQVCVVLWLVQLVKQ